MWQSVHGEQLFSEYFQNSNIKDSIPDSPGIYMWKPNLSHNLLKFDPNGLLQGLIGTSSYINGTSEGNKVGHSLAVSSVVVKGDGLTEPKVKIFSEELQDAGTRNFLVDFLDDLSPHCPSLYVGEGEVLSERIVAHVNGSSDFAKRLIKDSDWNLQQLTLFYLELPNTTKNFRQALEAYATIMTGAWLVRRAG